MGVSTIVQHCLTSFMDDPKRNHSSFSAEICFWDFSLSHTRSTIKGMKSLRELREERKKMEKKFFFFLVKKLTFFILFNGINTFSFADVVVKMVTAVYCLK